MNAKSESGSGAANGMDELPFVPECGSGPGLFLLTDETVPEASVLARAQLFAEEGYVVDTLCGAPDASDIRNAAGRLSARAETTGGLVCVAHGDTALAAMGVADLFDAIVAFDAPPAAGKDVDLANLPCPVVFQFGTMDTPDAAAAAEALSTKLDSLNGDRV